VLPSVYATQADLASSVASLDATFQSEIAAVASAPIFSGPSAPISVQEFAPSQAIDQLSGVNISNSKIDAASIPDLSGKYLSLDGGAVTGTTTFSGDVGIEGALNVNDEGPFGGSIFLSSKDVVCQNPQGESILIGGSTETGGGCNTGASVVIGEGAQTTGSNNDYYQTVIGYGASAVDLNGAQPKNTVIGATATALGDSGTAIGYDAAVSSGSVAIGSQATASSSDSSSDGASMAIGTFTHVTGKYSANIGGYALTVANNNTFSYGMAATLHGFGTLTPQNRVDISGAAAIGSYAGADIAPTNGLIVSGNVGIGTTSPYLPLSVVGNGIFTGGTINLGTSAGSSAGFNLIDSAKTLNFVEDSVGDFEINDPGGLTWLFAKANSGSNPPDIGIGNYYGPSDLPKNNLSVAGTASVGFGTNGDVAAPTNGLLVNGSVGIGTTTPGSALTVNGYIQQAVGGGSTVAINPFSINYTDKYFLEDTLINGTIGNSGSDQASVIIGGSSTGGNGDAGNAYYNTVVGSGAETTAVDGNTAVGALAQTLGTGSADMTAIGRNSTASSTTGAPGSIALGARAAALGDDSMAIGYNAAVSGSHSLALGPGASVTANNTFVYGGSSTLNGFGTTTPYSRLEVWGPDTAASTSAFSVVNNASTTVFAAYDNGNATYSGSIFQSSDQRLKTNVQSLDASSSLSEIESLNPVSYLRLDQPGTGENLGFIAQQVQLVFPQLVSTSTPTALTRDGTLTLNYEGLISPIVSAIQALHQQLTDLVDTVAGFADSFTSKTITATNELCIDNSAGSPVCVTGDQLAAVLSAAGTPNSSESVTSNGAGESAATDTPPVIEINGDNPAAIDVSSVYTDLGATITGPQSDLNLGIEAIVDGGATTTPADIQIDTTQPGTHTIEYVATDQNGLEGSSTRTLIVTVPAQSDNDASSTDADITSSTYESSTEATSTPSSE
jgi:hypothetical protein